DPKGSAFLFLLQLAALSVPARFAPARSSPGYAALFVLRTPYPDKTNPKSVRYAYKPSRSDSCYSKPPRRRRFRIARAVCRGGASKLGCAPSWLRLVRTGIAVDAVFAEVVARWSAPDHGRCSPPGRELSGWRVVMCCPAV